MDLQQMIAAHDDWSTSHDPEADVELLVKVVRAAHPEVSKAEALKWLTGDDPDETQRVLRDIAHMKQALWRRFYTLRSTIQSERVVHENEGEEGQAQRDEVQTGGEPERSQGEADHRNEEQDALQSRVKRTDRQHG